MVLLPIVLLFCLTPTVILPLALVLPEKKYSIKYTPFWVIVNLFCVAVVIFSTGPASPNGTSCDILASKDIGDVVSLYFLPYVLSVGPVGPAGPAIPCSPCGPGGPIGPCIPCSP